VDGVAVGASVGYDGDVGPAVVGTRVGKEVVSILGISLFVGAVVGEW
jgi:hypothetical protein